MTEQRIFNVLFLCSANSARSIMAEAVLNSLGGGRFRAFSAGSHPAGNVHPLALNVLTKAKLPTEGLRSKSWDEFARRDAPIMDFVFTLCDQTAGEACPDWPGQPMTAHWGFEDPALFDGTTAEKILFFAKIFREIQSRIAVFLALPIERLSRLALRLAIEEVGKSKVDEPK